MEAGEGNITWDQDPDKNAPNEPLLIPFNNKHTEKKNRSLCIFSNSKDSSVSKFGNLNPVCG